MDKCFMNMAQSIALLYCVPRANKNSHLPVRRPSRAGDRDRIASEYDREGCRRSDIKAGPSGVVCSEKSGAISGGWCRSVKVWILK